MYRFALLLSCLSVAATASAAPRESWLLATDRWGNREYEALELQRDGTRLGGTLGGRILSGEHKGSSIRFEVSDGNGTRWTFSGRLDDARIVGTADFPDTQDTPRRMQHPFVATRLPARPEGPPRRRDFVPVDYANEFSPHRDPVLVVWPGDTVHTRTIDSGGVDAHGDTRALYGNPQTGPFYIGSAKPGDMLVVHIRKLRLDRDEADSLDDIVGRALGPRLAAKSGALGKPVRWKLERERGVARPLAPTPRLRHFEVPLRPMLGGLGVAPGFGSAPASTGDSGRFGGNMDFNEIVEGNTVYLPVFQPGALLYLGDAHALQGDGETSQYALETSMDVEFTVDVVPDHPIQGPRVESPTEIMALGQAGSLDDALRAATAGIAQWLEQDHGLDMSEIAQVLGTSVRYTVANLAGRNVGIAARLDKRRLAGLTPVEREPQP